MIVCFTFTSFQVYISFNERILHAVQQADEKLAEQAHAAAAAQTQALDLSTRPGGNGGGGGAAAAGGHGTGRSMGISEFCCLLVSVRRVE